MPNPLVVHCKRAPFDVYIGRPSKWGNPFTLYYGSRPEIISRYKEWVMANPDFVAEIKAELRGKILGCWCAPLPCHGDVLAEIANS